MELHSRRLLQLNYDIPSWTTISSLPVAKDTEPTSELSSSPSLSPFRRPLESPSNSNSPFDPNIAYTLVLLLTAFFFVGFFAIYIRQFADESSTFLSSGRRRQRHQQQASSGSGSGSAPFFSASYKGLDPTIIDSLPVSSYHDERESDSESHNQLDCAICLSEFEDQGNVKMIPYCKHIFHPACIDKWLLLHVTCPVCRSTHFIEVKMKDEAEGEGGVGVDVVEQRTEEAGEAHNNDTDTCVPGVRRTISCWPLEDHRQVILRRSSSV